MSVNITDQRIIFSDNGVLSDMSGVLNSFRKDTQAISYVSGEDYIYIGSVLPFNHKFFDVETANASTASVSIDLWDGNAWQSSVDVFDETNSNSAVSLAESGNSRFRPDSDTHSWQFEDDSFDVDGLVGTNIKRMYWSRWSFDADISVTLNYVGHKFSDDDAMFGEYPELNNSTWQTQFESGKTDWDEQHLIASEYIVRDLITRNLVLKQDQILEPETFQAAGVHKTAEIIFGALGEAYKDRLNYANAKYLESMSLKRFNVDKDLDGVNDMSDKLANSGVLYR